MKRHRRGSRFPKRRNWPFWDWMGERLRSRRYCDANCGRLAVHRCHVIAKGSGGYDEQNLVLLCASDHERSEKRYEAFKAETGIDLLIPARDHWRTYRAEIDTEAPF